MFLESKVTCAHAGIVPIAESYTLLIHAFMAEGDVESAESVMLSMERAGLEARPGWITLTTALMRAGMKDKAAQYLKRGARVSACLAVLP